MCGIVGIYDMVGQRPIERDVLARMNESQFYRGPDAGGLHAEQGLGLGHRRLAIIDLSTGQQPLFNKQQTVVVTFNGEIYNFRELRLELEAYGCQFATHCDTEVIVYAWEIWGERCVDHFRGMFAFALWDRTQQCLFLARDRLGVKPLHYAVTRDGFFIFASELKALRCHPGFPSEIDRQAVEEYFAYGYVPDPKTIYKGVCKLAPGHHLTLRRGQGLPQPQCYWDVRFSVDTAIDEISACGLLLEKFREAVDIRRVADVPLGAFLSGGVDSSAVVAMMAGLSTDPVNTASISFGDPQFNESPYARQVSELYKTRHRVDQVDPADFSLIDQLAGLYDEPYADSSALPTYRVCELARKQVVVALSGDGGDENLAGYRRYRWHAYEERVRALMPYRLRRHLFGMLGAVYPKADWAPKIFRAKTTFQALARDSLEGYFHGVSVMPDALRGQVFSQKMKSDLQGYQAIEVLRRHVKNASSQHPLSLVQYIDLKTYLPGDILTKVDRASMAHSLEVRVPLLDHKLVEWMASLPPDFKLRGREGKYIFKKALEPYLPKEILYRPKMGFSIPLSAWFRGPLQERVRLSILNEVMADSGLFDMAFLKTMLDQHQAGRRDYGAGLWSLLMYESFLRQTGH